MKCGTTVSRTAARIRSQWACRESERANTILILLALPVAHAVAGALESLIHTSESRGRRPAHRPAEPLQVRQHLGGPAKHQIDEEAHVAVAWQHDVRHIVPGARELRARREGRRGGGWGGGWGGGGGGGGMGITGARVCALDVRRGDRSEREREGGVEGMPGAR